MNHRYRLVFNQTRGVWQAVSELARGRGKSGTRAGQGARVSGAVAVVLMAGCAALALPVHAQSTDGGYGGAHGTSKPTAGKPGSQGSTQFGGGGGGGGGKNSTAGHSGQGGTGGSGKHAHGGGGGGGATPAQTLSVLPPQFQQAYGNAGGNGGAGKPGADGLPIVFAQNGRDGGSGGGGGGGSGGLIFSGATLSTLGILPNIVIAGGHGGNGGAGAGGGDGTFWVTPTVYPKLIFAYNGGGGGGGGGGGSGGDGLVFSHDTFMASLAASTAVTGGAGGLGGVGGLGGQADKKTGRGTPWGSGGAGGNGGQGGRGIVAYGASGTITSGALIAGGSGGAGGNGGDQGNGGQGGAGGSGMFFLRPLTLDQSAGSIQGGAGGNGGNGGAAQPGFLQTKKIKGGNGGSGGSGADALVVNQASVVMNSGSILGGKGGDGGAGGNGHYKSNGGNGGGGGSGIVAAGSSSTITNRSGAVIAGGNGGNGNVAGGDPSPGGGGAGGNGGIGIRSFGGTNIINAGTLQGGLNTDGTRAYAALLVGGGNRLELQSGFSMNGRAVADNSGAALSDTLAWGGTLDSNFQLSQIGTQYAGFGRLQKTGSSTWTLLGTAPNAFNGLVSIDEGALVYNGTGAFSSTSTQVGSFAGSSGTLRIDGQSSSGTVWQTGTMTVGSQGAGTLEVQNGGGVHATGEFIVGGAQSGTFRLSGVGSNVNAPSFVVGSEGIGAMQVSGGAVAYGGLTVGAASGVSGSVILDGSGSQWVMPAGAKTAIGLYGTGSLQISNGARMDSGVAAIGAYSGSSGTVTVSGAGSSWNSAGMYIGTPFGGPDFGGTGTLTVSDGAIVDAKQGDMTLADNSGAATINIGSAAGVAASSPGVVKARAIKLESSAASVVFNHLSSSYDFAVPIAGVGQLSFLGGTTRLTGDSSAFSGSSQVSNSTLALANTGKLGGTLAINSGGRLEGTGSAGATVVNDGGTIAAKQTGSLTINGNLLLNANSAFEYRFDQASSPLSLASRALTVNGDLTLNNGSKLNLPVSAAPGDIGYNRLINYSGALANGGFALGTVATGIPMDYIYSIDATPAHGVDLLVQPDGINILQRWGGTGGDKGTGTWDAASQNWDNLGGTSSVTWKGAYGIFRGPGGTVNVQGTSSAVGLQFVGGNYTLGGAGSLLLHGYTNSTYPAFSITTPEIRVLAGETAVINVPIEGIDGVAKTGDGVLALGGANTYTGGTQINGGTLKVSSDGNLGGSSGSVSLNNGALNTTASFGSNRNILLMNAAGFDVASGTTFSTTGNISGAGGLVKLGSGTLALGGVGSWAGGTLITDGVLSAQSAAALPSDTAYLLTGGTLALNSHPLTADWLAGTDGNIDIGTSGSLTVDQSSDTWYGGTISGGLTALLSKTGSGALLLTGANTHGATALQGGTLAIISDAALGEPNGALTVSNGATLATLADVSSGRPLVWSGDGVIDTLFGTTFVSAGTLTGNGLLTKHGAGTLQLQTASPSSSTGSAVVQTGRLRLGNMDALRGRAVTVSANATLELAPTTAGDQTFSNALSGGGTVTASLVGAADSMTLANTGAAFLGTFAMGQGRFDVAGTNTQALANARLRADSGSLISVGTGTQTIGGLAYNGGTTVFDTTVPADASADGILSVNTLDVSGSGALRVALPSLPVPNPGPPGTVNLLSQDDTVLVKAVQSAGGAIGSGGNLLLQDMNGQTISSAQRFAIAEQGQTVATGTYDYRATTGSGNGLYVGYGLTQVDVSRGRQFTLRPDAGTTGTARDFSARVSGAGGLDIQAGAGQMVSLSNASNDFTGPSRVLSGTLAVAPGGQLAPASIISLEDSTGLDISHATTDQRVAGLESSAASASVVIGAGAFSLGDASHHLYSGSLQGGGSLVKLGSGKQVLDGLTAVGSATVAAGTLIVGANADSLAQLVGDVNVAQGATLGGHGLVTGDLSVAGGGTLAPGNSIGTISVIGDVSLAKGSILAIEAQADGASDKLVVGGTVNLGGATLQVTADQGNWAPITSYAVVQADTLTGVFDNVTSSLAFLSPRVAYTGTTANLSLLRNDLNFASIARTHNQRASAGGIESLGVDSPIYDAILGMSADTARSAYDNLSGEIHASTTTALFDDSSYLRQAIFQRLRGTVAQDVGAAPGGTMAWVQGYGGWGRHSDTGNTASLSHDTSGAVLGVDVPVGENWRAGLAGAFGYSRLSADARNSNATINSRSVSAYLGGSVGQWRLRAGSAYSWNSINTTRRIQAGPVGGTAKAKYGASTVQVFGEAGYEMAVGGFKVEPYLGLAHVHVSSDGLAESGSIAALTGQSARQHVTYGTLGVHATTPAVDVGKAVVNGRVSVGWQHAFGSVDPVRTLAFAGGDRYSVDGAPLARDSALLRIGVQAQLSKSSSLSMDYAGQYGGSYVDNGVRLNLKLAF